MLCDSGTANAMWWSIGPEPEREGHVVHGLLAEHPRREQRAVVVLDRLAEPEPERRVVLVGGRHVGGGDVDVVEAVDARAMAQVVALDERLDLVDLVHELDVKPSGSTARTASPKPGVVPAGTRRVGQPSSSK